MILITLVSISSYCQYPTTKILNNDTVVIMTLKQGREINNQFSNLKDNLSSKMNTISELERQLKLNEKNFQDSLNVFNKKMFNLTNQNFLLMEENKRIQKKIWSDKKERRFTAVGFLTVVIGWLTFLQLSK